MPVAKIIPFPRNSSQAVNPKYQAAVSRVTTAKTEHVSVEPFLATSARPGTPEKVEVMRLRRKARHPIHHPDDAKSTHIGSGDALAIIVGRSINGSIIRVSEYSEQGQYCD